MMAARVAGVPSPVSFIASDSSFSSRLLPAVAPGVENLPTQLPHDGSRSAIPVHSGFRGRTDGRNHRGHFLQVLCMPQHQQTPADQVKDFAFFVREPVGLHRDRGGNNRVVVADLAVVDITLAQGSLPSSRSQVLLIPARNNANNLG